ncbi:MAG: response regulator [Bdellovibrionales bacterium]|nr:response regulator [Bdellovibrionales bacterium]
MLLKVVYVDDEPELLDLFRALFEVQEGLELRTYVDAKRAIVEVTDWPPDLIFLDYRMPQATGDEVAFRINPNIPKALITGDLLVKPQAPFVRVFNKPFDIKALRVFIRAYQKKLIAS